MGALGKAGMGGPDIDLLGTGAAAPRRRRRRLHSRAGAGPGRRRAAGRERIGADAGRLSRAHPVPAHAHVHAVAAGRDRVRIDWIEPVAVSLGADTDHKSYTDHAVSAAGIDLGTAVADDVAAAAQNPPHLCRDLALSIRDARPCLSRLPIAAPPRTADAD